MLIVCVAAVAGCRPTKLAGRSVGQYAVTATLAESSCGDGHPAPPSFSFYVELREEPASSSGYWKLADGPLIGGSLDDGAFRFEQRAEVVAVPQDPDTGVVGCVLARTEVVEGELPEGALDGGQADGGDADAGVQADLHGETTVTVTPVAGGDCSPLLLPLGGAFPTLPCALRYRLQGEELDEPLW